MQYQSTVSCLQVTVMISNRRDTFTHTFRELALTVECVISGPLMFGLLVIRCVPIPEDQFHSSIEEISETIRLSMMMVEASLDVTSLIV